MLATSQDEGIKTDNISAQSIFPRVAIFVKTSVWYSFFYPIISSALIGYVESDTAYPGQGYMWATTLFSVTIVKGIIRQMFFQGRNVTFVRVGNALMAAVYRKVGLLLLVLFKLDEIST